MDKKNSTALAEQIPLIIGLAFFAIGIFILIWRESFKLNAEQTTAIIIDVDSSSNSDDSWSYSVLVVYRVGDKGYSSKLNYYSSSAHVGKSLKIYYNPDDPTKIMGTGITLSLISGIFFILVGASFFIKTWAELMKNRKLLQTGQRINAEISGVERNYSVKVNGVHAYYIACRWIDPSNGVFYIFKSKNVWRDPQPILDERNIKTLPVYIDRQNPNNYHMDISCIEDNVKNSR